MTNKAPAIDLDAILQDGWTTTSKEAADWAVALPREDFEKVLLLMYRQYKTFIERMDAAVEEGIEEFSRTNLENDSLVYCLEYLKGYLKGYMKDRLLESKEELTNV